MHITCKGTGFQPGANLEAIEPYSIHDSVWLLSRAIMSCTEVGDVQALDVSSRMLLNISRSLITSHQMIKWFQGTSK